MNERATLFLVTMTRNSARASASDFASGRSSLRFNRMFFGTAASMSASSVSKPSSRNMAATCSSFGPIWRRANGTGSTVSGSRDCMKGDYGTQITAQGVIPIGDDRAGSVTKLFRPRRIAVNDPLTFQRCLGGGEPGDRDSKRTATDVFQSEAVTEFDTGWIAPVFAANPELDLRARFASHVARRFHQAPHALLINGYERVCLHNIALQICGKEAPGIVPAHCEGGLGEVVRAEAKELGVAGDLVGHERRARNFNHGPHQIFEFCSVFPGNLLRHAADDVDLQPELARESHQGNHDFRAHLDPLPLHLRGSLEDRARLHLGNFRINNPQPATTVTEHWVKLVEVAHAPGNFLHGQSQLAGQLALLRRIGWQKFVQRRVQKTDGGRKPV